MNTLQIWLVEDDVIFKAIFEQQLLRIDKNINFTHFKDAQLALNQLTKIDNKTPKIIFLDLEMPVMDGFQFLESFAKLSIADSINICVITSSIDSRDFKRVSNTGLVKKYLIKPLKLDSLKMVIQELTA